MTNQEKHIENMAGKGRPFRVPDGYFDGLTTKIMSKIPENEVRMIPARKQSKTRLVHLAVGIAASVCVAIFGVSVYMSNNGVADGALADGQLTSYVEQSNLSTSYEDDIADYAMIDNYDIYAYISGE